MIKSISHLQMSASSESDSSNCPCCDSDGEFSVASSYGTEVQDCRKRLRQTQIIGSAWVLHAQIIMDQLHADSDSMAAGQEVNVENEDRITKVNTCMQGLFGAQFEILFGKLHGGLLSGLIVSPALGILLCHSTPCYTSHQTGGRRHCCKTRV